MKFSILSSLCLRDNFSFTFYADICVALEAVIIAWSVKENCCSNMLLLSVVTGKMLFRYRIGIFKPCLTQNCLSSTLITVKPSLQINFCSSTLIVSLENKLCDMLKYLWCFFLMICFTDFKKTTLLRCLTRFVLRLPLKQDENTNGPLNWPSNWALWKSNGCHHGDWEIYRTAACFPPVRLWKVRIRYTFSWSSRFK